MKLVKFASIDIGSNAVRLLFTNVFETPSGPVYRKLSLVRVPIRLGEDAFTRGEISTQRTIQLVKTMQAFKHLMSVHGIQGYKAYATSALREAANAEEIVEAIREYSDINIEIVSGDQEADTISSEQIPAPLPPFTDALFMDVGGGSTELTLIRDQEKVDSVSFKLGTIRLLHGVGEGSAWNQLDSWLQEMDITNSGIPLIGTGGNINKLLKMLREQSVDYFIQRSALNELYGKLKELDYDERIVQFILNPDRADVILPACELFLHVSGRAGTETIHIPKVGLSDGIARTLYKDYREALGQST